MSNVESLKKGLRAWEAGDVATMSSLLADDFVLSGPVPQPLGKKEFLGFMQAMMAAFPNFKFNEHIGHEQGETVHVTSRISATHTGTLALPGMPAVPATGKHVQLPEEPSEYTFSGGKLHKLTVSNVPGGGIPGLLAQIGVNLPG